MPFFITDEESGKTGNVSPGKVIAWFWMLAAMWISAVYFGITPWNPVVHPTFWEWIIASFVFGTMSAGFYWGLAKSGFEKLVDALAKRVGDDK